jgi:hypothetical protein
VKGRKERERRERERDVSESNFRSSEGGAACSRLNFYHIHSFSMASAWDLWLTPTISLSLIIEAESAVPSITRFVSQSALYFQPYLLKQALEYEVEQRPELDVISAGTLRVVDYSYFRQRIANRVSPPLLRVHS